MHQNTFFFDSPLGPTLADILMTAFEDEIVRPLLSSNLIKFYSRYVDDTLIAGSPYYVFWIQLPWYFAGIFFIMQYTSEKHAGSCIQNTQ